MILFNITFAVDLQVREEFMEFIRRTYIPAALKCGMKSALMGRPRFEPQKNMITGNQSESFALQMIAPTEGVLAGLTDSVLPLLYDKVTHWGPSVTLFPTVMDIVKP